MSKLFASSAIEMYVRRSVCGDVFGSGGSWFCASVGAILSTAAAMTATVVRRRRALASHQVQGFGFLQLWASLLAGAALLLGFGSAIGAAVGLGGQLLLTRWLRVTTGFPAEYVPALLLAFASFALVAAVALAVIAIPGWWAARTPLRLRFAQD